MIASNILGTNKIITQIIMKQINEVLASSYASCVKGKSSVKIKLMLLVLLMSQRVFASTGIIAMVGDNDPLNCETKANQLNILPINIGGSSGDSWNGMFLLGGHTKSRKLVMGTPNLTQPCLPRFVPFVQQYSYLGQAGTDATLISEQYFYDIIVKYDGTLLFMESVKALKYATPNSVADNSNNWIFAALNMYTVSTQVFASEMFVWMDMNLKVKHSTINRLSLTLPGIFVRTNQDVAHFAADSLNIHFHSCSHFYEGQGSEKRNYNIFIDTTTGSINDRLDQNQVGITLRRGCSTSYLYPRGRLTVWSQLVAGSLQTSIEPTFVRQFRTNLQATMTEALPTYLSRLTQNSPETLIEPTYTPTKIVIDHNVAFNIDPLYDVFYLIGEPMDHTGENFLQFNSSLGRAVFFRYFYRQTLNDADCKNLCCMIQHFVINFLPIQNFNANSFFAQFEGFSPHSQGFTVVMLVVPAGNQMQLGTIKQFGKQFNSLVTIDFDRNIICYDATRFSVNGQLVQNINKIHDPWILPNQNLSATVRSFRVWGRSCATITNYFNPCYLRGVGQYVYWPGDFIYAVTTNQQIVEAVSSNFAEGVASYPTSGTDTLLNGGTNAIIVASTRKHASFASQTPSFWSFKSELISEIKLSNNNAQDLLVITWWTGWNQVNFVNDSLSNVQFSGPNSAMSYNSYAVTGHSKTEYMQWPSTGRDVNNLLQALFVSMGQNALNWLTAGGTSFGAIFKFAIEFNGNGQVIPGVFDFASGKWTFPEFPTIDQNLIVSQRVTPVKLLVSDNWGSWRDLTVICISSDLQLKEPEMSSCLGINENVLSNKTNFVQQYSSGSQYMPFKMDINSPDLKIVHFNNDMATRECTPQDQFTVTSNLDFSGDVSDLPIKLMQSQLAINPNWVNTVQKINLVLLDKDGSIYQNVPFINGYFEINNNPNQLNRSRNGEMGTLLVMQRECADIQATPSNFSDLSSSQNRLQLKQIPIYWTLSKPDCFNLNFDALKKFEYWVQWNDVAYNNSGFVQTLENSVPNMFQGYPQWECPMIEWFIANENVQPVIDLRQVSMKDVRVEKTQLQRMQNLVGNFSVNLTRTASDPLQEELNFGIYMRIAYKGRHWLNILHSKHVSVTIWLGCFKLTKIEVTMKQDYLRSFKSIIELPAAIFNPVFQLYAYENATTFTWFQQLSKLPTDSKEPREIAVFKVTPPPENGSLVVRNFDLGLVFRYFTDNAECSATKITSYRDASLSQLTSPSDQFFLTANPSITQDGNLNQNVQLQYSINSPKPYWEVFFKVNAGVNQGPGIEVESNVFSVFFYWDDPKYTDSFFSRTTNNDFIVEPSIVGEHIVVSEFSQYQVLLNKEPYKYTSGLYSHSAKKKLFVYLNDNNFTKLIKMDKNKIILTVDRRSTIQKDSSFSIAFQVGDCPDWIDLSDAMLRSVLTNTNIITKKVSYITVQYICMAENGQKCSEFKFKQLKLDLSSQIKMNNYRRNFNQYSNFSISKEEMENMFCVTNQSLGEKCIDKPQLTFKLAIHDDENSQKLMIINIDKVEVAQLNENRIFFNFVKLNNKSQEVFTFYLRADLIESNEFKFARIDLINDNFNLPKTVYLRKVEQLTKTKVNVTTKIKSISQDGVLTIEFKELMKDQYGGVNLSCINATWLDITLNLTEFTIETYKNEANETQLASLDWRVISFIGSQLVLKLELKYPLYVARQNTKTKKDMLVVNITDLLFFRNRDGQKWIDNSTLVMQHVMRRQMSSDDFSNFQAKLIKNLDLFLKTTLVIALITNVFFAQTITRFLQTAESLHILVYTFFFKLDLSANLSACIQVLVNLLNADIIDSSWTTELVFNFEWDRSWIQLEQVLEIPTMITLQPNPLNEQGFETFNPVLNLNGLFVVMVFVTVQMLLIIYVRVFMIVYRFLFPNYTRGANTKLKRFLDNRYRSLFFTECIQLIRESYLTILVSLALFFNLPPELVALYQQVDLKIQHYFNYAFCFVLAVLALVLMPCASFYLLYAKDEWTGRKWNIISYSELWVGYKSNTRIVPLLFWLRRLLLVYLIIYLPLQVGMQLLIVQLSNLFYLILIGNLMPFSSLLKNKQTLRNEFLILIITNLLYSQTNEVSDENLKYNLGSALLCLLLLYILIGLKEVFFVPLMLTIIKMLKYLDRLTDKLPQCITFKNFIFRRKPQSSLNFTRMSLEVNQIEMSFQDVRQLEETKDQPDTDLKIGEHKPIILEEGALNRNRSKQQKFKLNAETGDAFEVESKESSKPSIGNERVNRPVKTSNKIPPLVNPYGREYFEEMFAAERLKAEKQIQQKLTDDEMQTYANNTGNYLKRAPQSYGGYPQPYQSTFPLPLNLLMNPEYNIAMYPKQTPKFGNNVGSNRKKKQ